MEKKPHYFEVVMNSVSEGVLNQEVILVREYAKTGAELTAKQMQFTRSATVPIVEACVKAFDEMSMPYQELGMAEMIAAVESLGKPGNPNKP